MCPYSELFWFAFFLHFPAFRLNTERYPYSVRMRENAGKMRARIIPNTDTFYVVPIKMDFLSTNWPVYVIIMIRNQRKLIPLKAK